MCSMDTLRMEGNRGPKVETLHPGGPWTSSNVVTQANMVQAVTKHDHCSLVFVPSLRRQRALVANILCLSTAGGKDCRS